MAKLTGIIQTFEPIFERLGITYSREAAIYYVLSISNSSLNFTETLREANKIRRTISQRALKKGQDYLLDKGFLAKVLFTHNGGEELEQRGGYIPVNPMIVFKENEAYLREIYEPEDFSVREKQVADLYAAYDDNYGEYGLKIEKGSVTLHYSRKWIVSYIASIISRLEVKTLLTMLNGLRVFEEPYRQYYEDKMGEGLKVRMIFGGEEEIEEVEETKALRNKYEEDIEIRYTPSMSRTSKSFIVDDKLAMDGTELLTMNGDELSYIGILYLNENGCIKDQRKDFEAVWKMSKDML